MLDVLQHALDQGWLRLIDYHFARFMHMRGACPLVQLASALTSVELHQGHCCLDLRAKSDVALRYRQLFQLATVPDWLTFSNAVRQKQADEFYGFLCLEYEQLYLKRYQLYEAKVAEKLIQLAQTRYHVDTQMALSLPTDFWVRCQAQADLKSFLIDVFDIIKPEQLPWEAIEQCCQQAQSDADLVPLLDLIPSQTRCNWQTIAVELALRRQLTVIAGGPGTGKTTIVARLIVRLLLCRPPEKFRIMLAAPTGKAAARMLEALQKSIQTMTAIEAIHANIPTQATTLHRLLGIHPQTKCCQYDARHPLPVDLLIVDEASMIDIVLMAQLLEALPSHARLVLLGDQHQLASVEAGAFMSELCQFASSSFQLEDANALQRACGFSVAHAARSADFRDNICLLHKSWRFSAQSGIGQFAQVVKSGDATALEQFVNQAFSDLRVHQEPMNNLQTLIVQYYGQYLEALMQASIPEGLPAIFQQLQRFCMLTPHNTGRTGTIFLNRFVEKTLQNTGLLPTILPHWYVGRVVMIRENAPMLGLYNGDIGITALDVAGQLCVWFEDLNHVHGARCFKPGRLPRVETAFAMTVHKSQGCEFNHCAIILPLEYSPLLTRELLYTAITRAQKQLDIFATQDILYRTIRSRVWRKSALSKRLLLSGSGGK